MKIDGRFIVTCWGYRRKSPKIIRIHQCFIFIPKGKILHLEFSDRVFFLHFLKDFSISPWLVFHISIQKESKIHLVWKKRENNIYEYTGKGRKSQKQIQIIVMLAPSGIELLENVKRDGYVAVRLLVYATRIDRNRENRQVECAWTGRRWAWTLYPLTVKEINQALTSTITSLVQYSCDRISIPIALDGIKCSACGIGIEYQVVKRSLDWYHQDLNLCWIKYIANDRDKFQLHNT